MPLRRKRKSKARSGPDSADSSSALNAIEADSEKPTPETVEKATDEGGGENDEAAAQSAESEVEKEAEEHEDDNGDDDGEKKEGSRRKRKRREEDAENPDGAEPQPGFETLGLNTHLCGACRGLRMVTPTPIQRLAIPAVLRGCNVLGHAPTGTGKTAAFALPIVQKLAADPYGVFAVVLTPSRELGLQIAEQFRSFGSFMGLRDGLLIGGGSFMHITEIVAARPHVVIATPAKMGEFCTSPHLRQPFQRLRFLVLDEADRLFDEDEEHLRLVMKHVYNSTQQLLLFSATLNSVLLQITEEGIPIRALRRLAGEVPFVSCNAFASDSGDRLITPEKLKHTYVWIPSTVKEVFLYYLLREYRRTWRKVLVFTNDRKTTELLNFMLQELHIVSASLTSMNLQKARFETLERFRRGGIKVLIATDLASRGLDIPRVDVVINYDFPFRKGSYIHRVGRTARAGESGLAVSFVTPKDINRVHKVEADIGLQLVKFSVQETNALRWSQFVLEAHMMASKRLMDEHPELFEDQLRITQDPMVKEALEVQEDTSEPQGGLWQGQE
eukprot:RCo050772